MYVYIYIVCKYVYMLFFGDPFLGGAARNRAAVCFTTLGSTLVSQRS